MSPRFCRSPLPLASLLGGLLAWVSSLRFVVLGRSGLCLFLVGVLRVVLPGFPFSLVVVSSASLVLARSFLLLVVRWRCSCVALPLLLAWSVVLRGWMSFSLLLSLRCLCSLLLLLVVVVGLSPLVLLRWFVRWLLLVGFGCRFLLPLVPLVLFPLVCLRGVLRAFLPGPGLPLLLLVVWVCLVCCSCLLMFPFLCLGRCLASFRWAGAFGSLLAEFSSWGFAPFFLKISTNQSSQLGLKFWGKAIAKGAAELTALFRTIA